MKLKRMRRESDGLYVAAIVVDSRTIGYVRRERGSHGDYWARVNNQIVATGRTVEEITADLREALAEQMEAT